MATEDLRVHPSRFVIVRSSPSLSTMDHGVEGGAGGLLWFLVSSNNRRLGQDSRLRPTYTECHDSVARLRRSRESLESQTLIDARDGRWIWRVSLGGELAAVSSRSYLRARECEYNLRRFLTSLAEAEVVEGVRRVVGTGRHDRRPTPGVLFGVTVANLRLGRL